MFQAFLWRNSVAKSPTFYVFTLLFLLIINSYANGPEIPLPDNIKNSIANHIDLILKRMGVLTEEGRVKIAVAQIDELKDNLLLMAERVHHVLTDGSGANLRPGIPKRTIITFAIEVPNPSSENPTATKFIPVIILLGANNEVLNGQDFPDESILISFGLANARSDITSGNRGANTAIESLKASQLGIAVGSDGGGSNSVAAPVVTVRLQAKELDWLLEAEEGTQMSSF